MSNECYKKSLKTTRLPIDFTLWLKFCFTDGQQTRGVPLLVIPQRLCDNSFLFSGEIGLICVISQMTEQFFGLIQKPLSSLGVTQASFSASRMEIKKLFDT